MDALNFCIKDNRYFDYKDKINSQRKGLPIGSPVLLIVSDITMESLLNKSLDPCDKKPKFLTKYVDDLFGIIKPSVMTPILTYLNNFHKLNLQQKRK